MKLIDWIERVDPHVLPFAVDAALSLFSAALVTAVLKMLFG
jgi:hypothetical protein